MLLYWLTLGTAAAIVLVLAGYLIAIAWALSRARAHVSDLADGLEAVAGHTEPLPDKVGTIAGALESVRSDFAGVNEALGGAAGVFRRG